MNVGDNHKTTDTAARIDSLRRDAHLIDLKEVETETEVCRTWEQCNECPMYFCTFAHLHVTVIDYDIGDM